ncbi:GH36-type glycosyl hydrolase domain-containing protein [Achromobacter sp. JUb104]|uniref:GH36-type glycosyl hydrolase domain-containing protein n=1 Tax=Achromobacter sp. JUb104 TaxID=2940590 RepID=UPI0021695C45|nr:glucoamylase family protein [Achromobacter sp. JUb104]MCS3505627.1 cellobiose phosphorylase [Achromobacter sp. JUb104]
MKPIDWPSLEAAPEWIDLFARSKPTLSAAKSEPPLRAELFNAVQMESHGRALAQTHVLGALSTQDKLLPRLNENQTLLGEACALLIESMQQNRQFTPADEWLLDNFYLIEEQIRLAKRHLPKGYSRSLPKLASGPSQGLPRVYDIALEMISHSDARIDSVGIAAFVTAYQSIAPLQLGELWAIPIMMRLALIENLRRVAIRLAYANMNRGLADTWADAMRKSAEEDPTSLILVIANMARSNPPIDGAFVAELARRLQGHGPALALPLTWFEQRLAQSNLTIEQMVVAESQQQAADQVSISNSIGSLRALSTTNWNEFVEAVSLVEQTLRQDPAEVYADMDFPTRDRYRHRIERLAHKSPLSEIEVAALAIELATAASMATSAANADASTDTNADAKPHASPDADPRRRHVGYYLIDKGQSELVARADVRQSLPEQLARLSPAVALAGYAAAIVVLTAAASAMLVWIAHASGAPLWALAALAMLSVVATSHLAVAIINWALTWLVSPQRLPRMDYARRIPNHARTLVAVPSMLITPDDGEQLSEALEIRFLANPGDNLSFCLLTDFADANAEHLPTDALLLERAKSHIQALNHKYRRLGRSPFFLLHRPRRWNARERVWMGQERKRGKLADLNALLRSQGTGAFSCVVGQLDALDGVKYVITLDTDTELPRESACKLVGAMAHPLNQAQFDPARQRVTRGYGILQPRVAVNLADLTRSAYARLQGGDPGIDPYTNTVSDVYQDIFKEGSFIGKGIYDVDAFEAALKDCFPDNRVLSHDLLEGCYARSGLLSDVQLFEGHPPRYTADVSRRHRWIRGDWQLLGWLIGRPPGTPGAPASRPLPWLARCKILDNLRRSLVAPCLVLLMTLGWTQLPYPWLWTAASLLVLFVPALFASAMGVVRKQEDVVLAQHLVGWVPAASRQFARAAFALACLAHETLYNLDAILRTLYRLTVSRRRLLEWKPSSLTNREGATRSGPLLLSVWGSPLLALAIGACVMRWNPAALPAALPVLALWALMPLIAWRMSRTPATAKIGLAPAQEQFLRLLARKTWAFFDGHGGAEDNWLIPDNVQDLPAPTTAHRTSPTNLGLALLANLTAYDFGYLQAGRLLERTQATLATMGQLERYLGHFYNWYDTLTLKPLHPLYISTVDSGNLAGHLLTLRPGLLELAHAPILHPRTFEGLSDALAVLREHVTAPGLAQLDLVAQVLKSLQPAPSGQAARPALTLAQARQGLERVRELAYGLLQGYAGPTHAEALWHCQAMLRQCEAARDELTQLAPWPDVPADVSWGRFPPLLSIPTLQQVATQSATLLLAIRARHTEADTPDDERAWLSATEQAVMAAGERAAERCARLEHLADTLADMAVAEYGFLYDKGSRLLAIGYNLSERRRDDGLYDLLASEARLCSFVAIAQGQLPQETWFALGRQLSHSPGGPVLLSWSGSMFEYLMPRLVMPSYPHTLLDQTCLSAVRAQIDYGDKLGIPWGMSESAYHLFDGGMNYQYRAFGVPGLGLKRGLADDVVVAPYASMLALMVMPDAACRNLQRLAKDKLMGRYGLYEAIDYTPRRQPPGKNGAIVQSYMAHHQGMGLLSIANVLLGGTMQARFEADPSFQATMLLLQERVPRAAAAYAKATELSVIRSTPPGQTEVSVRVLDTADTPIPEVQLLSNGRYHVMVTNSGAGSSRWKDLAVTRWREDSTCDNWGTFSYVRDVDSGKRWSTTFQPTLKRPDRYEVIFSEGRAEFRRSDHQIDTYTEIVVSPEDDIELRRCRLTNRGRERRTLEFTCYAEVVIAPAIADELHPAFSNLFVQTEILPDQRAILCTRRGRSPDDNPPWMFQLLAIHGGDPDDAAYDASFETDRAVFLGRGRGTADPHAMATDGPLSGSQCSVLDPVSAIRCTITLEPEQTVVVDLVQGVGDSREACMHLISKYQDRHLADRALELAWTHAQVIVRQLNATDADAQLYARLANSILYQNPLLRAEAAILLKNRRGQSGLWGYAISGDLPIVLLRIKDPANFELVRQLVQAHAYWRQKGVAVDLVIWNEDTGSYRQALQDRLMGLISAGVESHIIDRPGGIFVRSGDQISEEDRTLLQAVARVSLSDALGTLSNQVNRLALPESRVPPLVISTGPLPPTADTPAASAPAGLLHGNGLGGFTPDSEEYVITTTPDQRTPAPWVNVIANPHFGTVVSESGQAYSWSGNAHEFRLTPWRNDSVSDTCGEAFYLRDEISGHYWSAAPYPSGGISAYVTRHGFGYTVFEHVEDGIESQLCVHVARDAAIKFYTLTVRNRSGRRRRLSATGYVEWVLGDLRSKSSMHVTTEIDPQTGAVFARNSFNADFSGHVAFFDTSSATRTATADRREFIGRNGTLRHPQALRRSRLSGRAGAGLDPCAAIQVPITLEDGQEQQVLFLLGDAAQGEAQARNLARRYREPGEAANELVAVRQAWRDTLSVVRIDTPDAALNTLANGWLLYQTLACRVWARSGHYQSSGAYGFRDQLQDTMALAIARPDLTREHLLRSAAQQFVQADVQHWWHPPTNRGVRTQCSDDYLWLPFAVTHYVAVTGDADVLNEDVGFIEGRALNPSESSNYDHPTPSRESASLYEHCARALSHALSKIGAHGLPLIGSCDWNDGMDKVGEHGRGVSVWLGFFLHDTLNRFARLARTRDDLPFAMVCESAARQLGLDLEQAGWDGRWYRRAYFDDGSPLGSAQNLECQIDSISQSWSVLSGVASADRAQLAMQSVAERLIDPKLGLIRLLTPAFDTAPMNPGYIRGYVPGVRENGGQYTHAAVWTAMAFCALQDQARVGALLHMLNPIHHADTAAGVATYKVEPYVMAADIYTTPGQQGRGGWTWYTGSSGLMYRLILESVLGMRLRGNTLSFQPCLPADWSGFTLRYRHGGTTYTVTAVRGGIPGDLDDGGDVGDRGRVFVDGVVQHDGIIPLQDDGRDRAVTLELPAILATA